MQEHLLRLECGQDQRDGGRPQKEGDMMKLIIDGVIVDRINEHKDLGRGLDNKLTFECNTINIVKKYHQTENVMHVQMDIFWCKC